jgi:holo-[acyl-carrier protein] synthase
MIIGIGNDILEIERIKKSCEKKGFLEKHFTAKEIELFQKRHLNPSTIAANFSGKEAVSKVFGTGIRTFELIDIELLRTEEGQPYITLYNEAKRIGDQLKINHWHITISHTKALVSVVVLGEHYDHY